MDQPAFGKLMSLLRYIDGDYADPATSAIRTELGERRKPLTTSRFRPVSSPR